MLSRPYNCSPVGLSALCAGAALALLEETLARLCARGILTLLCLVVRTPALLLARARFLTAAAIRLRRIRAVAGSHVDFKADDFVPHRVRTVAFGHGEQFAQAAFGILRLALDRMRLMRLGVHERRFARLFGRWLFFVHNHIIPQMPLACQRPEKPPGAGAYAEFPSRACGLPLPCYSGHTPVSQEGRFSSVSVSASLKELKRTIIERHVRPDNCKGLVPVLTTLLPLAALWYGDVLSAGVS